MYYNDFMDKTIRNLDPRAFRAIKARAAAEGRTVGEVVSEAMVIFCARPAPHAAHGSILDLVPRDLGPGTETLSSEVDAIVYGI